MAEIESNKEIEIKGERPTGKQVLVVTIVLCICAIAFTLLSAFDDAKTEERGQVSVSEGTGIVFDLGDVTMGEYIRFDNGYALMQGNSIQTWDIDVVLEDEASGEAVAIPTYMVETETAKSYFAEGDTTYNRAGFAANVKRDRLELNDHTYKVLLYYNNNEADIYVDTGYILTEKGIIQ